MSMPKILPEEFDVDNKEELVEFLKIMIEKISAKHDLQLDREQIDTLAEKAADTMLNNIGPDAKIQLHGHLLKPEFIMRLTMTASTISVLEDEKLGTKDLDGRTKDKELALKLEKFFEKNEGMNPEALTKEVENEFKPDELMRMKPLFEKMMKLTFPDHVAKNDPEERKELDNNNQISFCVLADNVQSDAERGVVLCFTGNPSSPNLVPATATAAPSAVDTLCDALFTPTGINEVAAKNMESFVEIAEEAPSAYSSPRLNFGER